MYVFHPFFKILFYTLHLLTLPSSSHDIILNTCITLERRATDPSATRLNVLGSSDDIFAIKRLVDDSALDPEESNEQVDGEGQSKSP